MEPEAVTVTGAVSDQPADPPVTDDGAVGLVRSSCTVPAAVTPDQADFRPTLSVAWNWTNVGPVAETGTEEPVVGLDQVVPLVDVSYW